LNLIDLLFENLKQKLSDEQEIILFHLQTKNLVPVASSFSSLDSPNRLSMPPDYMRAALSSSSLDSLSNLHTHLSFFIKSSQVLFKEK